MRLLLALIGSVLALAASAAAGPRAPVPAPAAVTATTFFVSGRGWGHGVGMSQYGALGYANDGWTYDQILAHFYTGAELGPSPVASVRVLVLEGGGSSVKVSSKAAFRVRDVFGKTYALPAGEVVVGPAFRVSIGGVPTQLAQPIVFIPGKAPLELDRPYRGQIEVMIKDRTASTTELSAVNVVGLEQYLAGVVPLEMPSEWPEEALKAQAVAARSYALARRVGRRGFDLYADVRSQVYGGIAAEHPRATAAVQATAGEVLLWEGMPIDALFHSTSGGATADVAEVFGTAVPYLVSVDDPHSLLSPVHRWGPTPVPEATIRKALKLRAPLTALKLTRAPSGRVASVQAVTAGGTTKISGATLRSAAGLRSTWITQLATLSLTRPGGPAVYGKPITITGKAAGVKGAVLSQRIDGVWTPLASLTVKVKLLAPTSFRLTAGKLAGPVLAVPVAPLVTARVAPQTVMGTVKPLAPGTSVQLQLDSGGVWSTSAETTLGPAGEYTLTAAEPGTYRVRVAPAQGFAEGLSAQIVLP